MVNASNKVTDPIVPVGSVEHEIICALATGKRVISDPTPKAIISCVTIQKILALFDLGVGCAQI